MIHINKATLYPIKYAHRFVMSYFVLGPFYEYGLILIPVWIMDK